VDVREIRGCVPGLIGRVITVMVPSVSLARNSRRPALFALMMAKDKRKYPIFIGSFVLASAVGLVSFALADRPGTVDHIAAVVSVTTTGLVRDADVPDLPFPDNPDPTVCGIPVQWGSDTPAWLNGMYEGTMLQSEVLLYDSHQRFSLTGSAPHGTQVEIH